MDAKTAAQIALVAIDYEDAFNALNKGLAMARADTSKLADREWTIDMGLVVAKIRAAGVKARKVKAADAALSDSLTKMAGIYDEAMTELTEGIDARNAAKVSLAAMKISRGDTHLREVVGVISGQ